MRLVERYEGRLRIESGFVDGTDADSFAPMMIRAAVVAGEAVGAAAFAVWRIPHPDTTAAAPEFVQAAADRQLDQDEWERRITIARLIRIGSEREEGK
jgi:hypothetical protein